MDRRKSFLAITQQQTEHCLLCNKGIAENERISCLTTDGWTSFVKNAKDWSSVNIPPEDKFYSFKHVHSVVQGKLTPFGKRHIHCRAAFGSKIKRYITKYGLIKGINDDQSASNEGPLIKQRITRASSEHVKSLEKLCSICQEQRTTDLNPYNQGGLGRCESNLSSGKIIAAMDSYLNDQTHKFYKAASRVQMLLSGPSHDLFSADIYYHQSCYLKFTRVYTPKNCEIDKDMERLVLNDFFTYIRINILRDQNAYLLNQLLEDWKNLCCERDIETLLTRTNQLRQQLENKFPEDIGFFPSGKYVIVHSTSTNPCHYAVATLKGSGLRDLDITKSFAAIVRKKLKERSTKEIDKPSLPMHPDELLNELDNGPLQILYNVIYLTLKNTCSLNEYGYATTSSRNLATKIWSLSNDWETLITKKGTAKQILLGMTLHRMTGKKEVVNMLHNSNHVISYNDIKKQNNAWEKMVIDGVYSTTTLKRGVPTHSSLDNNDGRQETVTGYGTTHHTNSLFFQPSIPRDEDRTQQIEEPTVLQVESNHPGTKELIPYSIGLRKDPQLFRENFALNDEQLVETSFDKDIVWSIAGGIPHGTTEEPKVNVLGSWTAFRKQVSNMKMNKSSVQYLPVIPEPPDYTVLKNYLDFLLDTTENLGIKHIFAHADEAVYEKLLHIIWNHGDYYKNIIPLMGGFHQVMVMQKIIHKRHSCMDYKKWFEDSKIIAAGSIDKAIEGRQYYRCIRIHKEGLEAIIQTRVEGLTENYKKMDSALFSELLKLSCNPSLESLNKILLMKEYKLLKNNVVQVNGTQSKMTLQYLKDVSLMLSFVAAARESNIELHLQAEEKFLKMVFAFDHVNYARYNSYQHLFLCQEKKLNSQVYQDLFTHGFVATVTGDRFSGINGDLLTEWFNKETKGTAAPFRSGYSTQMSTVNTWVRTAHIHCKLKSALKQKLRIQTSCVHKELTPGSKVRHQQHIDSLKATLESYNINLFSDGPARAIPSGNKIDEAVIEDLLTSDKVGKHCYDTYVNDRLVKGEKSIFSPITKNNLRTGLKKKKVQTKAISVLKEDRQAFGVMIAKSATLEEAFQYPMTSVPLSIAEADGTIRQGDKAGLRNLIIQQANAITNRYPTNARWIYDGMAVVRAVKPCNTYEEFFKALVNATTPPKYSNPIAIEIVMDTYIVNSVKESTRRRRGESGNQRVFITGLGQKMPQGLNWQSLLNNNDNKTDLIHCFVEYMKLPGVRAKFQVPVVVNDKEETWLINRSKVGLLHTCNHEEADSRIVVHAVSSDSDVVVVAKDTDVFLLLSYAFHKSNPLKQWYMKYDIEKYADIRKVNELLDDEVLENLMKIHALTGCDTTSYFYRIGKIKVMKKLLNDSNDVRLITSLGKDPIISNEGIEDCKRFVQTVMYNGKNTENYVNTRIRLYKSQKNKTSMSLPPDQDSCKQAIKRANYQAYFWNRCTQVNIPPINLLGNGWIVNEDNELKPVWFLGSQLPPSLQRPTRQVKRKSLKITAESDTCPDEIIQQARKKQKSNTSTELANYDGDDDEDEYDEMPYLPDDEWEHLSEFDDDVNDPDSSDSDWCP